MMYKLLILFSVLFCCRPAVAQFAAEEDTVSVIENYTDEEDSSSIGFAKEVLGDTSVYFRDFALSNDSISAWKNKKEYSWIKNIDSLLRDAQNKAKRQPPPKDYSPSFLDKLFNSGILKILLWGITAVVIFYIIRSLFLTKGLFRRETTKATGKGDEPEDEARLDRDFDSLFRNAYHAGDYRQAMRYLFLKTLQRLNERGLIVFAPDKMNSIYVNELPPAKKESFATLALYYEYIWYGNAAIQKETFDTIENKFTEFINKI